MTTKKSLINGLVKINLCPILKILYRLAYSKTKEINKLTFHLRKREKLSLLKRNRPKKIREYNEIRVKKEV